MSNTAWVNCKTYGQQWFNPSDPESYPKICDDDECKACSGTQKRWNDVWDKLQDEYLKRLMFGEDERDKQKNRRDR